VCHVFGKRIKFQNQSRITSLKHFQDPNSKFRDHWSTRVIRLMTLETLLQDASILQLTEALVSKSDQVFVFMSLTPKTCVTFCGDFVTPDSSPARTVTRSPEGCRFSQGEECITSTTGYWQTRTAPPPNNRSSYLNERIGTSKTPNFVQRIDKHPLDRNLPNCLNDQPNAIHLSSTTRSTRTSFRLVSTPRIWRTI
jgi:hypothetical protein